ncbi:MAG: glycosyltransferase family 2 protein [Elusimicrobia bacterium]|nr:glycosyltransferase family 2 protein [Elusimicrobiota bacterium]
MNNAETVVIIVNWNGERFLKDCLGSVFAQGYINFNVILVDNGSTDGSIEFIKKNYSGVEIIPLDKNYGFAKANNIGMEAALKDKTIEYIALLNNDTKAEKNWLGELINTMSSDNKIGICASKMLRMDNPHVLDSTGHIFIDGIIYDRGGNEPDKGQYDKQLNIVGACAGACLYRKKMLEAIGLFDESFGSHYEDAELSWRAYKAGWKAKYAPESIVYHKRGGTSENNKKLQEDIKNLSVINIVRTIRRHATAKQKLKITLIWVKGAIKQRIGSLFCRKKFESDYLEKLKLLWLRNI